MFLNATNQRIAVCLLLLLSAQTSGSAAERTMQLRWPQLAEEVVGHKISTVLSDGVSVEGKVTAVNADALVVDVKKTSDKARFFGSASLPRTSLTSIRVSRPGWKWRVIIPAVAVVPSAVSGAVIAGKTGPPQTDALGAFAEGLGGAIVGVAIGVTAGYIAGHFMDKHTRLIQIVN